MSLCLSSTQIANQTILQSFSGLGNKIASYPVKTLAHFIYCKETKKKNKKNNKVNLSSDSVYCLFDRLKLSQREKKKDKIYFYIFIKMFCPRYIILRIQSQESK